MAGKYGIGDIMISQEQILRRAGEIGRQMTRDFAGEDILVIGILKGAVLWLADVVKEIGLNTEIDFIAVSSYGALTKSTGVVKIIKDIDIPVEGKNIIIIEDIVDSGTTLSYLKNYLLAMNPKSLKICTLLDKPARRSVEIDIDYVGFTVEDKFIVGYGLDFNQRYRNLPYITCLTDDGK